MIDDFKKGKQGIRSCIVHISDFQNTPFFILQKSRPDPVCANATTFDYGIGILGIVPGFGKGSGFVLKYGDDVLKAVGLFSKYEDITKSGSKLFNFNTDVTKIEFEQNLLDNGFTKSTSKDGNVNIFTKGDTKYTTREFSKSTGGPTAEVFNGNKPVSKIRLGDE